jgi:hypothetical protein
MKRPEPSRLAVRDWRDPREVIEFARSFGPGYSVLWDGKRCSIVHTKDENEVPRGREVIART